MIKTNENKTMLPANLDFKRSFFQFLYDFIFYYAFSANKPFDLLEFFPKDKTATSSDISVPMMSPDLFL